MAFLIEGGHTVMTRMEYSSLVSLSSFSTKSLVPCVDINSQRVHFLLILGSLSPLFNVNLCEDELFCECVKN